MPDGLALPDDARGEIFLDARGNGRALRLTWHPEADMVVLSLWRQGTCAGTFRLLKEDVSEFIDALVDGLREGQGSPRYGDAGAVPPERVASRHVGRPTSKPPTRPCPQPAERAAFTDWAFSPDPGSHRATAS
jgi:hypothetical protein